VCTGRELASVANFANRVTSVDVVPDAEIWLLEQMSVKNEHVIGGRLNNEPA
jgi:hypothetical protein